MIISGPQEIAETHTALPLPSLDDRQSRVFLDLVRLLQLAEAHAGLSGGLRLTLLGGDGGLLR